MYSVIGFQNILFGFDIMPVEVKYLDDGIGFNLSVTGIISGRDLFSEIENFYQSEHLITNRYGIIEFSCAANNKITNFDVRAIAEISEKSSKIAPNRIIALISKSDVGFGLSRMWEILAEKTNWDTRVFRSRSDAEKWLRTKVFEKFNTIITLK